jgi:hypothetical protein
LSLPPGTGQAATVAISMPGTVASMPKRASPHTFIGLSSRLTGLPISSNSFGLFSGKSVGIGKVAAMSTRAP